jgi:hypothetical protein
MYCLTVHVFWRKRGREEATVVERLRLTCVRGVCILPTHTCLPCPVYSLCRESVYLCEDMELF